MIRYRWLLWAVVFLMTKPLENQSCFSQETRPNGKLVAAIDQLVQESGILASEPGIAILIRHPGKLMFQKGYGLANIKSGKPITNRTMFELASVSKTFTATAILILHDRGQLSIMDDVRKYLPELPNYDRNAPILVQHLLNHTSGLPEYLDLDDVPKRHMTYWCNEDYLNVFSKRQDELSPTFRAGNKYDYCNTNFMLLAIIIERVGKKSYGQFLRDEIFTPARMEHSFVYERPQSADESERAVFVRAVGYEWNKKKKKWQPSWGSPPDRSEEHLTVGDGGIWTNLEDMAHWDDAIRARKLLKPETWKLALVPSRIRNGNHINYGLGWSTYFDQPTKIYGFGHDGSWGGFQTSYYRDLTEDVTTVVLSNRGNIDTDKVWAGLEKIIDDQSEQIR